MVEGAEIVKHILQLFRCICLKLGRDSTKAVASHGCVSIPVNGVQHVVFQYQNRYWLEVGLEDRVPVNDLELLLEHLAAKQDEAQP